MSEKDKDHFPLPVQPALLSVATTPSPSYTGLLGQLDKRQGKGRIVQKGGSESPLYFFSGPSLAITLVTLPLLKEAYLAQILHIFPSLDLLHPPSACTQHLDLYTFWSRDSSFTYIWQLENTIPVILPHQYQYSVDFKQRPITTSLGFAAMFLSALSLHKPVQLQYVFC